MKKCIALLIIVAIAGSSVVAFAQEQKKDQPRKEDQRTRAREVRNAPAPAAVTKPAPGTEMPGMPGMGRMDMSSMMESRSKQMEADLAKKKAESQAQIDQWKAILKLAEDEKATKTAEAIKKVIAQKEAEMNKEFQAQEERMKQMQEQMKLRMDEMKKRQEAMKNSSRSATPATPAVPAVPGVKSATPATPATPAPKAVEKAKDK